MEIQLNIEEHVLVKSPKSKRKQKEHLEIKDNTKDLQPAEVIVEELHKKMSSNWRLCDSKGLEIFSTTTTITTTDGFEPQKTVSVIEDISKSEKLKFLNKL